MPGLTVVHTLDDAPDGWAGETGHVDAAMIARHVPERQLARYEYFVCGSPAMLDAMEALLIAAGVPARHLNTERFDFV
jgi:NAD(P)H-flavin reductase